MQKGSCPCPRLDPSVLLQVVGGDAVARTVFELKVGEDPVADLTRGVFGRERRVGGAVRHDGRACVRVEVGVHGGQDGPGDAAPAQPVLKRVRNPWERPGISHVQPPLQRCHTANCSSRRVHNPAAQARIRIKNVNVQHAA